MAEDKIAPAPTSEQPVVDAAPAKTDNAAAAPESSTPVDVVMTDAPPAAEDKAADAAPSLDAEPKGTDASADAKPSVSDEVAEAASSNKPVVDTPKTPATVPADGPKSRQKSSSMGSAKKTPSKKQSKAKTLHTDAKPGDLFIHKLKGYPAWPVIICDEEMLSADLLKSRPVSAIRQDGTYREDYADGGKNVAGRTFPVLYLASYEFGWAPNHDLQDLDPETAQAASDKIRNSALKLAYELAAEGNSLDFYKQVLQEEEERRQQKKAAQAAKRSKKSKAVTDDDGDDGDVAEANADLPEEDDKVKDSTQSRKRKAEDDAQAPQRSDSVKKPKIKLTSTPKNANGAATPKSSKDGASMPARAKPKKATKGSETKAESEAPKEPELTPEEKQERKQKEVLFLRHKIQRGLLTRDQEPKEEEMPSMSEYITKLEGFPDLEVDIIRNTKINKVLKAILKLESIPREEEFHFKARSQVLLEKWTKILASEAATTPAPLNGAGNGARAESNEDEKTTPNGAHKSIEDAPTTAEEATKLDGNASKTDEGIDKSTAEPEETPAA